MSTFLFDKIIFGPVQSRRLGVSLGVNLLSVNAKVCSFDCIYCECGWTNTMKASQEEVPSREEVARLLEEKLLTMAADGRLPDVITFAGNGEPTLHPMFAGIIDDTIALRNRLAPDCRIAVLSNATMTGNSEVFNALLKIDDNILKLDSALPETIRKLNCPMGNFQLQKIMEKLAAFGNKAVIQTLFVRGVYKGEVVDNTTGEEIDAWIKALRTIKPGKVMIYSLARDTPAGGLVKVPAAELNIIAERVREVGFDVQVS